MAPRRSTPSGLFPAYPLEVRRKYHTGKVLVKATIGGDGRVAIVQVLQRSGPQRPR
ncbi:MAG: energy transducer TonB [Verrucomicrobia bacterium]|nr:energy transducer TonB [Verrucomicrobiota bacterium]